MDVLYFFPSTDGRCSDLALRNMFSLHDSTLFHIDDSKIMVQGPGTLDSVKRN